jgi:predicted amidohydrolase
MISQDPILVELPVLDTALRYPLSVAAAQLRLGDADALLPGSPLDRLKADIVVFPEYFLNDYKVAGREQLAQMHDHNLNLLTGFSARRNGLVIGGSIVAVEGGRLRNRSYILSGGRVLGHHDKINLTTNELRSGFAPGDRLAVFQSGTFRFVILICNDILCGRTPFATTPVFHAELFSRLKAARPDMIFIPLFSRRRQDDLPVGPLRDLVFGELARLSGAHVVKVGSVGQKSQNLAVGRSLIADARGTIVQHYSDQYAPQILVHEFKSPGEAS